MAKVALHLTGPSVGSPTLDDLIKLYRSLTGSDPTPEDLAEAQQLLGTTTSLRRDDVPGLAALGRLPVTAMRTVPTPVLFRRPVAAIRTPLNRKTTASDVFALSRAIPLEPTALTVPIQGLEAYLRRPRRDPADVVHAVMQDGRERWLIQAGHTRLGAALLRNDPTLRARVWEFVEDAEGHLQPQPRRRDLRGWDESQHPRVPSGSASGGEFTSGGDGGPAAGATARSGARHRLGDERDFLDSPKDALNSLVQGEKVYIAKADVRQLIMDAAKRKDDPNLAAVHVDGLQIFGGKGLGIDRTKMPQVPTELRDQFLKDMQGQGIKITKELVHPFSVSPTQDHISARKVGMMMAKYEENPKKSWPAPLVSKDNYILDGHHHWGLLAALAVDDPSARLPVVRLGVDHQQALKAMLDWNKAHNIQSKAVGAAAVVPGRWDLDEDDGLDEN